MDDKKTLTTTPQELAGLIETVLQNLSKLNQLEELPNVQYDSPNAREAYRDAANGIFEEAVSVSSEVALDCSKIKRLFQEAKTDIAKAAALNVYKKARAMTHDMQISATKS